MNEDRLMERVRSWKADPARRGRTDTRRQIDSVVSHLKKILNTKQGSVPIAGDYGIPDMTNYMQNYPDSDADIKEGIRHAIATYEPRLNHVEVSSIPEEEADICLRFQITAQLATDSGRNVKIETIVDSEGKFSVKY